MDKVEQAALNAVSDLISPCRHLMDRFTANDKTPFTDGVIDVYESADQKNATLKSRVAVQIKGRSVRTSSRKQKRSVSFGVEREVLRFFRDNGGGIYFYVSVQANTSERTVFYAVLTPFKSERYLSKMIDSQAKVSVQLKRMPADSSSVERIVGLAAHGQSQRVNMGFDRILLEKPYQLTIHSVDSLDLSRPASLKLDDEDFAVTMQTAGGLRIPVDVDVDMYPATYLPHAVDVVVCCGEVVYTSATVHQLDDNSVEFALSEGLGLTLRSGEGELASDLHLELRGSVNDQIKDLDFVLAMSAGKALIVQNNSYSLQGDPMGAEVELSQIREQLERISALFEALEIDPTLVDLTELTQDDQSSLLALHQGVVLHEEISGQVDGVGRIDIKAGMFKILVLVTSGSTSGKINVFDPFNLANRDKFALFRKSESGELEEMKEATVYDGLEVSDLSTALNLHLGDLVAAYRSVANSDSARAQANIQILRMLFAADSSTGSHRDALLQGAWGLNEWLLSFGDESPVHLINRWQILYRQGELGREHRIAIHAARKRALRGNEANANIQEVCYCILLKDDEQVEVSLDVLSGQELVQLHSWPIWSLYSNRE